jgi:alpha-ribazole phosphatase/probable phosphoglycerate mutase
MVLAKILDIPLSNLFRIKVGHACVTRVEFAEQGEEFLGQLIFHAGSLEG